MTERVLYRRGRLARFGWFVVGCGLVVLLVAAVLALLGRASGTDIASAAALASMCIIVPLWYDRGRADDGLYLAPQRLISRAGSAEVEVPIDGTVIRARSLLAIDTEDRVIRDLYSAERLDNALPHTWVLEADHDGETVGLLGVADLSPKRLESLCEEVNAALRAARREYNYPEPEAG